MKAAILLVPRDVAEVPIPDHPTWTILPLRGASEFAMEQDLLTLVLLFPVLALPVRSVDVARPARPV